MTSTPVSLLEELQSNSAAEAWVRFVRLFTPLMVEWTGRMRVPVHEQEDLIQDVFVTLFGKLPEFQYDPNRSFRAWLRTILLNKWRNKNRRDSPLPLNPNLDCPIEDTTPEIGETEYQNLIVARAAELAKDQFPETVWKAFWATTLHGQSVADTAQTLGITVNSVYLARSRVLYYLRTQLRGLMD